jgi:hypothetical protein
MSFVLSEASSPLFLGSVPFLSSSLSAAFIIVCFAHLALLRTTRRRSGCFFPLPSRWFGHLPAGRYGNGTMNPPTDRLPPIASIAGVIYHPFAGNKRHPNRLRTIKKEEFPLSSAMRYFLSARLACRGSNNMPLFSCPQQNA